MAKLKYRIVPEGAADGVVPINLTFIDKNDIDTAGLGFRDACQLVADDLKNKSAAINVIDQNAITVTSDGIVADSAVVAFASADHGKINNMFGFIAVSEIPYTSERIIDEPHMKQWNSDYYRGRRLYRGPSLEDKAPRDPHTENMTISGRIANNNTGSEFMNLIDMTEILVPFLGQIQIMRDGNVLIGPCGPEISVGIGMVVAEERGRIFGKTYTAGMTAHRSGIYAKTVKSDYPGIVADKKVVAEYTIRALEIGMIPGLHIGCSPVTLSVAKAMGKPIALHNISKNAWIELESIGFTRQSLEVPSKALSREEVIAQADELIPGMSEGKKYKVSQICQICCAGE
jgi:hypothetical protein